VAINLIYTQSYGVRLKTFGITLVHKVSIVNWLMTIVNNIKLVTIAVW